VGRRVVRPPPLPIVSQEALATLQAEVAHPRRPSHNMTHLAECVRGGLVTFTNNGSGWPVLTEAGQAALKGLT
jgi:hypothetical protein